MKILITSGGTKVPIDPVRDITNHSKGTFGSKIARAALESGHKVFYLAADDARSPYSIRFDFYSSKNNLAEHIANLSDAYAFAEKHRVRYVEQRFRNFADYEILLKNFVKETNVVVLAAAASDYLVTPVKTKIRSKKDLSLQFTPAPKLISKIKEWNPNVLLVGFKLLVNATDGELVDAAWESICSNKCDFVVANDLVSLKKGHHEILLVEPTESRGTAITQKHAHDLEQEIIKKIEAKALWTDFGAI